MEIAIWTGLFMPLIGFLILLFSSQSISRSLTNIIGCSTILISFLCFSWLLLHYLNHNIGTETFTLFSWIPVKNIEANFAVTLDHLSLLMTLIITGVGFLIHVYSTGYMDHEEDYARFFACLNFFVFCMLLLVLANHLLLLFVGWEGVGLASYLLIGFYYTRNTAAKAATKAFVMNRIGDLGYVMGILLLFYLFGTGDMAQINSQVGKFSVGDPLLVIATLLLFWGATAKSAQIPLQTWLADAMEGPTPVSALIHAATMVTAGVYLVVRMHALFLHAPFTLLTIGTIGAITSLYAALTALGQLDLKRVLAYSTVSQLGLMFVAAGAGAFYSAMFHLTMHAFVKALLFLSAGNVVHMLHGETDMRKMGGLKGVFPVTNWLFLIGALALAGIPPLATFFSKDLILEQEHMAGFTLLYYISLAASILTGVYMIRAYCMAFLGDPHYEYEKDTIKEAPSNMLAPLGVLGILSVIGGFLGCSFCGNNLLAKFLHEIGLSPAEQAIESGPFLSPLLILAVLGSFFGVGLAYFLYTRYADKLGDTMTILRKAFYLDEIYWAVIGGPLKSLSDAIKNYFEPKVFDQSLAGISTGTQDIAGLLQEVQSGQIRSYIAWMVLGTILIASLIFM